jgi:ABC-2 type transport system permease protein
MGAIYKREMTSFFTSPTGYVFSAIFFAISGICFSYLTIGSSTTDTSAYFSTMLLFFVVLIPLLTMKLLSEERKTKTEQILLTSPVSLLGIISAKFFAAYTIFSGTLILSSVINMISLRSIAKEQEYVISKMNIPTVVGSIVGILLIGGVFIAIGLFISALTENQIVAAVLSIGAFVLIMASGALAQSISNEFVRVILKWLSVNSRYAAFVNGVFDIPAVVYYISLIVVFIFLTVRIYEKRRWE